LTRFTDMSDDERRGFVMPETKAGSVGLRRSRFFIF
jgi:hypothetical protein